MTETKPSESQTFQLQPYLQKLLQLINKFLNFNHSTQQNQLQQRQPSQIPSKLQVKQIQNQLKDFSKQDCFFDVAGQLMIQYKDKISYQQLFIASLLFRDKFRYQFDKYNDENTLLHLQQLVKNIIAVYKTSPPQTFTNNLCIAMICLYIKRAAQLYTMFKQTGIMEYYKSFIEGGAATDYFYKAIQNTPEEIYNSKLVIDEVYKDKVKTYIKKSQGQVLKHLNTVAPQLWENKIVKKCHLFSALQNWISMGYKEELFQDLPQHFLVQKLFQHALDPTVSVQATECLMTIIKKIKIGKKQDTTFQFLGTGVFQLVQNINASLKQYQDATDLNDPITVVTDFGLLAAQFFIENYNPDVKHFLQSTIEYMKLQDLDAFPNLVDFWDYFINIVQKTQSLNPQFTELIKSAYAAICFKCCWKKQLLQNLNEISQSNLSSFSKDAEAIIERREQSEEFFETVSLVFGADSYLNFVVGCIQKLPNPNNEPEVFWPYLETYLSSLKYSSKRMNQVSQSVKAIVSSYKELNCQFVAVKIAYMNLFRSLMTIKQKNQSIKSEFIKHLFALIAQNFQQQNSALVKSAYKAFSKGCQENPTIVINYIEDFMGLLRDNSGDQEIVRGIMYVLQSDSKAMDSYFNRFLQIQHEIFVAAQNSQENKRVTQKRNAYYSLYVVFKIFTNYKHREKYFPSVVQFTKSIWDFVIGDLRNPSRTNFDEDPEVQRAVKLLKFIMRCLKQQFIPFLESLFAAVLESYRHFPICSYIYMIEVSITVYYQNEALCKYFQQLYKAVCQTTYQHLQNQTSQNTIQNYQLLIDDFIGMNKRFFIYNSRIVLESGELPALIQTCINLSNVANIPQVSKSAYQFFETIFMVYWNDHFIKDFNQVQAADEFHKDPQNSELYTALKEFIKPKLSNIVSKMIDHLSQVPLESTAECIMDALSAEIKGFPQQNESIWLPILQHKLPQYILTNSQKSQLYSRLPYVGSQNINQAKQSSSKIDRIIYIMNKRFINNEKRTI